MKPGRVKIVDYVSAIEALKRLDEEKLPFLNRWENGKTAPSKLAQRQFEPFVKTMLRKGASI